MVLSRGSPATCDGAGMANETKLLAIRIMTHIAAKGTTERTPMTQSREGSGEEVFDVTPYLKLFIDKEGRWFQNGAEIIHRRIYLHFNQCLEKTPDGAYQIRWGREICRVQVEDAPFVVERLLDGGPNGLRISLNDGTDEPFDPDFFWIGEENVPYITVKRGSFHARFSRPAYHELAKYIDSDAKEETFYIVIQGKRSPIKTRQG